MEYRIEETTDLPQNPDLSLIEKKAWHTPHLTKVAIDESTNMPGQGFTYPSTSINKIS